jgi:hypothetical protein
MPKAQPAEVLKRLKDYIEGALENERLLVETWKRTYPEAAKEGSSYLKPLMRLEDWRKRTPSDPDEIWHNDTYCITLRRQDKDPVFGTDGGMIQLGISSFDGTARHDWRDFQAIKNQLAGPECEAFELYPAEARLLDPSNYFSLWCFPGVKRLKIGQGPELREVRDTDQAMAPQRALPKPPDDALRRAAQGAWHLCQSLLAMREGATDELIQECADALQAALI